MSRTQLLAGHGLCCGLFRFILITSVARIQGKDLYTSDTVQGKDLYTSDTVRGSGDIHVFRPSRTPRSDRHHKPAE